MGILEQVRAIREAMDKAGILLTTEQAATVTYLFKPWTATDENGNAVHYKVADRRRYDEVVYECRQEHDALAHQTPDIVPALWLRLDVEHNERPHSLCDWHGDFQRQVLCRKQRSISVQQRQWYCTL